MNAASVRQGRRPAVSGMRRDDPAGCRISTSPGVNLKRRFERSLREAAGVVRDRGRSDRSNHLKGMIFAETRCEETIDVFIIKTPALFDHGFC